MGFVTARLQSSQFEIDVLKVFFLSPATAEEASSC